MIIRKQLEGDVEFNNGEFAEVLTSGTDGDEKGLALDTIQLHVEDTEDTPEQFQQRFPVDSRVSIVTTTEVTVLSRKE